MRRAALLLLGCGLALAACAPRPAANVAPAAGALPDWGGAWGTMRQSSIDSAAALQAAMKPEPLALMKASRDKALADDYDIRAVYCRPPSFGGFSGGFRGSIEFLFTPGRVSLVWEGGLVRRLFTDGRALPSDPDPTATGSSVAHWEGQTLVVRTVGLQSDAPAFSVPGTAVGAHATVTERMFLKDADTLQVDATLEAPDVLNRPATVTYLYTRNRDYTLTYFSACPQYDRSVDPATGRQRFDMTPPKDLAPPPTE